MLKAMPGPPGKDRPLDPSTAPQKSWVPVAERFARQAHAQMQKACFDGARAAIDQAEAEFNEMYGGKKVKLTSPIHDLEDYGISQRTLNTLYGYGLRSVSELLKTAPADLLGIANIGPKTMIEINEALRDAGYHWRDPEDLWRQ